MPRCCKRKYPQPSWWEAQHAGHRISFDHDHVIKDLAENYDAAILALESIAGWRTHRRVKGKMVLGNVNKIGAGLRNQRRSAPLETTEISLRDGRRIRLPTIEETLRLVRAFSWLIAMPLGIISTLRHCLAISA
jgi:hypothetical protein